MMKRILILSLVTFLYGQIWSQGPTETIIKELHEIDSKPTTLPLRNPIQVNNEGGHLQGIQFQKRGKKELVFLTGSSSTIAYSAVARMSKRGTIKKVHELFEKPLKHAGGFQICEKYMAVGVEDNDSRTYAEVLIYDISRPFKAPKVVQKIVRSGGYERVTAGCVAMTRYDKQWLLIVGNWNSRDLDIYTSPSTTGPMEDFTLVQSLNMEAQGRSTWSDPNWLAYQNINLIVKDQSLFLLGMRSNAHGDNVADLFKFSRTKEGAFSLQKVSSKMLKNEGGDFVWGSGAIVEGNVLAGLLSCERNLTSTSRLFFYR